MPTKGSECALLQKKLARENMLKEESSHRSRVMEREKYRLASQRNGLEEQRMNLRYGLQKLPVSVRQYYLERINNLTGQVEASKKPFPQYRGNYDMY